MEPVPESERLLELLAQWEELRQQGKLLMAEELCPDDPGLQAVLRERLVRRQRLQVAVDLPAATLPAPAAQPAALPVISGYEIGELLGRGGMELVFKARQKALKRDVALKMVVSGGYAGPAERARFRTEAEAVARLHHPGIVQIYEVGEQEGCPYLALEFVSGGSLAAQLDGTPMPPRRAAQVLLELACAVQHAHEQGIVHRDLKPANVLVTASGGVKITDFGLAKLLDVEHGQTQTVAFLGSASYMAPEQAAGHARAAGPPTDVYALGAILYELLSGRPPFVGTSFLDTLDQVRTHDPAPLQLLQPNVSADLAAICRKCLEKHPVQRYPSAAALAHDLDLFLRGEAITVRSLTLWDQAARLMRFSQLDVNWGTLANQTLALAPLPFLVHGAAFWLLQNRPEYPPVALGVTLATILTLSFAVFVVRRASFRAIASDQRRRNRSTWLGNVIGTIVMPLAVVRMVQPTTPAEWFVIYALWFVLVGSSMYSLAANSGILFFNGSLCFLLALLVPCFPFYAPLVAGALMSLNMTTLGLVLRRAAGQAAEDEVIARRL
jgi:serine/threonine-protein kinase